MDNQRYVLESFSEFLKFHENAINEKKEPGTSLDLAGAEELVKLIMADNALLAEKLYAKSEGVKGDYLRKAASSLKENKYALAGIYSIAGTILTRAITPTDFEILKKLDPNLKDDDLKTLGDTKKRKAKGQEMLKSLENVSEEDAKKMAEEAMKLISRDSSYIASGIKTPFIWGGLLSEEDRKKTYVSFLTEAQKRGYDTVEGLKKVIASEFKEQSKEDKAKMENPGLTAYTDKTESTVVKPGAPIVKSYKTAVVKEENQAEVFKPNMYGANGEADYMEGSFKEIVDNLGAIFQRMLTGEIGSIKSITVHTSADRYRNTGSAEKLSWGQLSFLRSQSMASIVVAMAQKSGLAPEIVTKINEMIKLDFRGGNGDGTSGPNAPEPIKFGYYAEEGGKAIWKEGKNREVIQVVEVDDEGTPKGEPKDVKKSPESDKSAYNKYRYNNIEIEYEAIEEGSTKEPTSVVEKVVDLKYPIKIKLPARYRTKTIKVPIPVITLGLVGSGGGGKSKNPTKCPDFGSSGGGAKVKTRFGFGIRTVTIANWESDITK